MVRLSREDVRGLLFISPWIVGFCSFFLFPMIYAIYISLTNWKVTGGDFVGLANYGLLLQDPYFWTSIRVTVLYSIGAVPGGMILGLLVAMLLNQKIKLMAFFRTMYYLPAVVSGVAVAIVFGWVFNTEYGVFNFLLNKLGLPSVGWLTDPRWALVSLVIISLWSVGGTMVIYLAGLQSIPTDLFEAAAIDGANGWNRFLYVTIPMMSPVLLFTLVMGVIGSFQAFTNAYVLTNGGPLNSTLLYMLYLYHNAWGSGYAGDLQMGYAAAQAWVLFLLILVITLLIFRSTPYWVYYETEVQGKRGER